MLAVTDHDQARGGRSVADGGSRAENPPLLADAGRLAVDWARARSLGPSSVCGISVALTLCAAAWLTAGTRSDNYRAVAALFGGYLALLAGRSLAARPGSGIRRARGVAADKTDVLAATSWLTVLGWSVSECAVYAGLAVGAAADRWSGMWILAIGVLSMVAVRELMAASSWLEVPDDPDHGLLRRAAGEVMRMPAGGRVLLIGVVAPVWGGRAALLALLDWTIITVGFGLAVMQGPGRETATGAAEAEATPRRAEPLSLAVLLLPASRDGGDGQPAGQPAGPGEGPQGPMPDEPGAAPADPAEHDNLPVPAGRQQRASGPESGPQTAPSAEIQAWRDRLIMLRDDGVLARSLGAMVRGNLLPLPPAVLGLAATAVLAYLGLRSVPGILILSPCLIMLLAAPGSGNRHAGRLDWMVPAVLLGWQCLYLTVVGQAQAVHAPVTFAVCAALLVWYADLACPGRPVILARRRRRNWTMELTEADRERGTALGWEGRMLLMGAAAAAGIGMLAYLALTVYLGVLICAKVLTTCIGLREGDSR